MVMKKQKQKQEKKKKKRKEKEKEKEEKEKGNGRRASRRIGRANEAGPDCTGGGRRGVPVARAVGAFSRSRTRPGDGRTQHHAPLRRILQRLSRLSRLV